MNKLTKTQFYLFLLGVLIILSLGVGYTWGLKFPGDYMESHSYGITNTFGGLHCVFNIITIIGLVVMYIITIWDWADKDLRNLYNTYKHDNEKKNKSTEPNIKVNKKGFTWKKGLILFISFYIVINLFKLGIGIFKDGSSMYNQSIKYQYAFNAKVQEKAGFYDKMWTTYNQKEKITNLDKQTFIEVTKLIMENRADGKNLTWKWLQENQQIPYDQFTTFYSDLSVFITTQREGYFNIEKECIALSNLNNAMLDTFPNNLYNKFVGCKKLTADYGFLSTKTRETFKTKTEK